MRERREEERKIVREGEAISPSLNEERRRKRERGEEEREKRGEERKSPPPPVTHVPVLESKGERRRCERDRGNRGREGREERVRDDNMLFNVLKSCILHAYLDSINFLCMLSS